MKFIREIFFTSGIMALAGGIMHLFMCDFHKMNINYCYYDFTLVYATFVYIIYISSPEKYKI